MSPLYATKIISKLGGTRPVNSTYSHLLQGNGGVTYNTSQAVIDIRIRNYILSRLNEISIPNSVLNHTNVKEMVVELFDKRHERLFRRKTTTMKVLIDSTKKLRVRFIRISILDTNDNQPPSNITFSIKGCFYKKHPRRTTAKVSTESTTMTTQSM